MRSIFFDHLKGHEKSNIAIIDPVTERSWTYGDILEQIEQIRSRISVDHKKLAFCFCNKNAESIFSYLGLLKAGYAIALLDASQDLKLKLSLIQTYTPALIFGLKDNPGEKYKRLDLKGGFDAWRGVDQKHLSINPELTLLLSTSGTTGSVKFVRLSEANLVSNALSISEYLSLNLAERAVCSLPFHYSYGLSVVNSHLLTGASLLLSDGDIMSRNFWDKFASFNCTSFAGVPYSYEVLNRIGFNKFIPKSLRTMTQAGGRLDKKLILRFNDYLRPIGARFFVMYGQTEATARISYLPSELLSEKAGSIGIPIPGGALSIVLDNREVLEPKTVGELCYKGPNVMLGYCTSPTDLSLGDVSNGTLRTGDLGYRDIDGLFYITGRIKRISKLYGFRINLDEIEASIKEIGPVAAVSNDERIVIYSESGDTVDFNRIAQSLADSYNININCFLFKKIEKLPLMPSGKVNYSILET